MYAAANEGLLKNPKAVAAMSRSNEDLMEYIESKMWQPGALLPPQTPTTLTTYLIRMRRWFSNQCETVMGHNKVAYRAAVGLAAVDLGCESWTRKFGDVLSQSLHLVEAEGFCIAGYRPLVNPGEM